MPRRSVPERLEDLEARLDELERERRAEEGPETSRLLEGDAGVEPRTAGPGAGRRGSAKQDDEGGLIARKGKDLAESARRTVGRVGELATGGLVGRGTITRALRDSGPAGTVLGLSVAATAAAPSVLEAAGQIFGAPAAARLGEALGEVGPVQNVRAQVQGFRQATASALAFGRAGVSLPAGALSTIQDRASEAALREQSRERKRAAVGFARGGRALLDTLGEEAAAAAEESTSGGREIRIDPNLERAGARVGGLIGQERAGARIGGFFERGRRATSRALGLDTPEAVQNARRAQIEHALESASADDPARENALRFLRENGIGAR